MYLKVDVPYPIPVIVSPEGEIGGFESPNPEDLRAYIAANPDALARIGYPSFQDVTRAYARQR
jgi:hypothetical protein